MKIVAENPIKIFVSIILATYLAIGAGFVSVDRAVTRTMDNKRAIERILSGCAEEKREQARADNIQNGKQVKTEKDIVGMKGDILHIKETVDRIEKKL